MPTEDGYKVTKKGYVKAGITLPLHKYSTRVWLFGIEKSVDGYMFTNDYRPRINEMKYNIKESWKEFKNLHTDDKFIISFITLGIGFGNYLLVYGIYEAIKLVVKCL